MEKLCVQFYLRQVMNSIFSQYKVKLLSVLCICMKTGTHIELDVVVLQEASKAQKNIYKSDKKKRKPKEWNDCNLHLQDTGQSEELEADIRLCQC